jgi:hypothetical protein
MRQQLPNFGMPVNRSERHKHHASANTFRFWTYFGEIAPNMELQATHFRDLEISKSSQGQHVVTVWDNSVAPQQEETCHTFMCVLERREEK